MRNMSPDILYMSGALWPHRTPVACLSPFVHGEHVQSSTRSVSLLSQIQAESLGGKSFVSSLASAHTNLAQVCKYVAKFRLLEHGLLDAAQGVDDLKRQSRKGKVDEEDDDETDESSESFEQRINLYVYIHLSRASSSKRDHYKDGLVYQARKDLINEFRKVVQVKKCQHDGCGAYVF